MLEFGGKTDFPRNPYLSSPQRRVQKTTAALRLCARRWVIAVICISIFIFRFLLYLASFSARHFNEWTQRRAATEGRYE